MVNNLNPYIGILADLPNPPPNDDEDTSDRKISNEALWSLDEIIQIVSADPDENAKMVTRKSVKDYENLEANGFDLPKVLAQIKGRGRFKGSWWCKTSPSIGPNGKPRGTGSWVPCDAYAITVDFEHPETGYCGKVDHYFKMCKSPEGSVVFFISLHL